MIRVTATGRGILRRPDPSGAALIAPLSPVADPAVVLAVLDADRTLHPYGIADVHQLWDCSSWWVHGPAAVGLIRPPDVVVDGGEVAILYAVAARRRAATLALVARLHPHLPDRLLLNGVPGLTDRLAPHYLATHRVDSSKHVLPPEVALAPPDPEVEPLHLDDLADLEALYATDPGAGSYFHEGLVATGMYLGVRGPDGGVIAAAGIHVLDEVGSVAAIGNVATHPAHRRRGLARRVVTALCHRLRDRVEVVGLNVELHNRGARRLYAELGFVEVGRFEEAALSRAAMPASAAEPVPAPHGFSPTTGHA